MDTIQIRAVIFKEASFWCAQCLERDIAVQGRSLEELIPELGSTLAAYVELAINEHRVPFADMKPAPGRFFKMFEMAHELVPSPHTVIEVDDAPTVVPELRVLEAA